LGYQSCLPGIVLYSAFTNAAPFCRNHDLGNCLYLWPYQKSRQLANFEEATYFSMVTYATVGYGDIVLEPQWRIMSGFEAMSGILLFGWSTAMLFSIVQKVIIWSCFIK
jgi:hypothetical protein